MAAAQGQAAKAPRYATEYNWSISPSEDLSQPGQRTVRLSSCPPGVTGHEPEYWVLISRPGIGGSETGGSQSNASGGSEPVKVTGGNWFTTARAHSAGYTVSSASSGLQEALIAARFAPTNPGGNSQSGTVIVPPGEYKAFSRVSIRASNMTVDFSGSIVECWMDDT
jgi:hypothetical protein